MKIFSIHISSIVLFFLYLTSCHNSTDRTVIYSRDYGFGEAHDCTPAALKMVEAAKEIPNSKIVIERGTYHFYPDKAYEKFSHITNHDDGLRSTPFPLIDFSGIEIEADSANFIFHGIILPVIIENSKNVKLSGFSIDWEIPLHSEVRVISVDELNHTFDIEISSDTPYELRNKELFFLKEGYEHNLERSICWDPSTMAVAYNTWAVTPLTMQEPATVRFAEAIKYQPDNGLGSWHVGAWYGSRELQNSLKAEELKPGLIRLSGHRKALPKVGNIIVAKGQNGYNRLAPAIHIRNAKDVELKNLTVHHAGGMGLIAERSENITLHHFNVSLREGSGRMLTTTADATHFNNCRGLIRISNCLFENMLDDGTNIHGVYGIVDEIIDKHTIGLKLGHFQQLGFDFARTGDNIGFIEEGDSFFPYFEAEVVSVQKLNKSQFIIEFNEKLDSRLEVGHLMDNLDWYPKVELVNNIVRNNRARGFLLNTHKGGICEGNYFSTMDEAISLHSNFGGYWYEAGIAGELRIRNNVFADCVYGGRERAVINFGSDHSEDEYVFKKISIEENEFRTFDPMILNPEKVDTLIVRNNTISRSESYPLLFGENPVIRINDVNYALISGNSVENYDQYNLIVADSLSIPNLHQQNNNWNND
ncbi:MAG: hypothetical protein WDZ47_00170 [Bacteroidales bacterium]